MEEERSVVHDWGHTIDLLEYYIHQVITQWTVILPILKQPSMIIRLRGLRDNSTSLSRHIEDVLYELRFSTESIPMSPSCSPYACCGATCRYGTPGGNHQLTKEHRVSKLEVAGLLISANQR